MCSIPPPVTTQSLGVVEQQGARHFDPGLERRGIVGRRLPFRVGEGEALEAEVVDRGAGVPDDPNHPGQSRGDDLGRPHLLPRSRQVVEDPLRAIEIPLAGRIEGLDDVLHPVGSGPVAGEEGEQARAVEGDGARLRVDALDRQPVVQPFRDPDDLHVPEVAPVGDDVARGVDEPPGRASEEVAGVAGQRFDPVLAFLRQPRPRPAPTVDEELPEPPGPGLYLGDVHCPCLVAVDLAPTTALEAASPAQGDLLARRRGIDHGSVPGPGILGSELQRRVEVVRPGTQDDADGSGSIEGPEESPDGFTGAVDRRERPIVLARVGQLAGPCVLPLWRDEEVRGRRIPDNVLQAAGGWGDCDQETPGGDRHESDRSHAGLLAAGSDRTILVGSQYTAKGFGEPVETFDGEPSGICRPTSCPATGPARSCGRRSGTWTLDSPAR